MADGRHFENRKIAISQWKIVRFLWDLVHYIIYWTRLQSRYQKLEFLKFKMAAAAILKIAFCHKSSTYCPISAKFCMMKQNAGSTRACYMLVVCLIWPCPKPSVLCVLLIKVTNSKEEQGNDNLIACDGDDSSTATERNSTMSVAIYDARRSSNCRSSSSSSVIIIIG